MGEPEFFGLSAWAAEAYGFMLVRPFRSCVTAYLENHSSDFDDFYILRSLKKCSSFAPQGVFDSKKPFWVKMAFSAYILETKDQILMIFSQSLDSIAFNDLAVLCTKKY